MIKIPRGLRTSIFIITALIPAFINPACSLFDRTEPVPAYVYVDTFSLTTPSNNSEGSSAHNIVDGWVYSNGTLIGAFELPAMVPILASGSHYITVLPGIKKNGRSNDRQTYPFYKSFLDTLNLVGGHIDTLHPTTEYYSGSVFKWIEDFEDKSISIEKSGTDVTVDSVQLTTDPALIFNDGKNKVSAFVELPAGTQYFENSSISKFDINRNVAVYLEMHYKLDVPMEVGLYAINSAGEEFAQIPILGLYETNGEWKKTYISLAEDINVSDYTGATFKVFFSARNSGSEAKRIYLDNIKLISF
ncbi:MAG: hypothetical protein GC181_01825 [Bacteroidetes bacterium]|nr:hypothetical protein [Bacteroidota bacterium]